MHISEVISSIFLRAQTVMHQLQNIDKGNDEINIHDDKYWEHPRLKHVQ